MEQAILEALPLEFQRLREAVHSLARLVLQSRLFPAGHPAVERALGDTYLRLSVVLERKRSVLLVITDGIVRSLNFEIDLRQTTDKAVHLLREALARHAVGEIEIVEEATKEELAAFARILASLPCGEAGADTAYLGSMMRNILVRQRREQTDITPERALVPAGGTVVEYRQRRVEPREGAENAIGTVVRGILERLEKIRSNQGRSAGAAILDFIERQRSGTATILLLNSLREFDDYTFSHSVNVAVISTAIARELGFGEDFADAVGRAALLHDIGKLYVPAAIIHKTARLTPSEWQEMKRHPIDGERILREEGLDLVCRRVAYEHHMRYDLGGYPKPKEGYTVHKASEIVRIADSYDALTTKRLYRRQLNPYEAVKLMAKGSGMEFHRDCLAAFLRVLGNIPIGSILKLSTGETVVAVGISESSDGLPRVRVIEDAAGQPVEDEVILDLNDRDPQTRKLLRRIVHIVDHPLRDVEIGKYIPS